MPGGWGTVTLGSGTKGKNITVYGANWCPHCHTEMRHLAGTGAKFVDCADTQNKDACRGIGAYPTIFKNGKPFKQGVATAKQLGL
eukprot:NODE_7290_length_463_cov_66.026570_g6461_i0.p3 GENE.NODE_7290_length_463_cov_66.026570_g6461_i0~~NODE_7290_length_463_cov_66.026570_g6461_i0.p3  ORF type:complete len:85 (-),score=25.86 NODE_7290_length_463_cov_66.026570_g6461_i0:136-390(-)